MPRPTLDATEARVVGALAEKSLATPDQYPMTLASLVAACNQKTAREPVTDLSARAVTDALDRLGRRGLAGTTAGAGHRVAKFRHLLDRALDLSQRELAVLAVLLLRGTQTAGELRTRTARLAAFESVEAVDEALWMLGDRDEPLVATLPRRPGQAADRVAHLLCGPLAESPPRGSDEPEPVGTPEDGGARPVSEFAALAARVDALEAEVATLREALGG